MERARGQDRGARADVRSLAWDRGAPTREDLVVAEPEFDEPADVDGFPVMVRIAELQTQIVSLGRRLDRFGDILERIERSIAAGALARPAWRGEDEPFAPGITARANPMTHPVTAPSARIAPDTGRDEALASVRALFTRRRPWWQRLPDLLRG